MYGQILFEKIQQKLTTMRFFSSFGSIYFPNIYPWTDQNRALNVHRFGSSTQEVGLVHTMLKVINLNRQILIWKVNFTFKLSNVNIIVEWLINMVQGFVFALLLILFSSWDLLNRSLFFILKRCNAVMLTTLIDIIEESILLSPHYLVCKCPSYCHYNNILF